MSVDEVGVKITAEGADEATAKVKQFSKSLEDTGKTALNSGAEVEQGINKGTNALKGQEKQQQSNTKANISAVASITGMTASIVGAGFAYGDLDKKQLSQTKAARTVEEVTQKINKLQKDGKRGTQEYADAQRDLGIANENLRIKTENVFQAQVALGFNLVTLATSTIPNGIIALSKLAAMHGGAATATGIHTGVQGGFAVAISATAKAIWAKTFAMLANPLFAIPTAAAIAAAVALVATNTWGLRDAIFGTTEAVNENTVAMTGAQPAIAGVGNAFVLTGDQAEQAAIKIGAAVEAIIGAAELPKLTTGVFDIGGEIVSTPGLMKLEQAEVKQTNLKDLQSKLNLLLEDGNSIEQARTILLESIGEKLRVHLKINEQKSKEDEANLFVIGRQNAALAEQARLRKSLVDLAIELHNEEKKNQSDRKASAVSIGDAFRDSLKTLDELERRVGITFDQRRIIQAERARLLAEMRGGGTTSGTGGFVIVNGKAIPVGTEGRNITSAGSMPTSITQMIGGLKLTQTQSQANAIAGQLKSLQAKHSVGAGKGQRRVGVSTSGAKTGTGGRKGRRGSKGPSPQQLALATLPVKLLKEASGIASIMTEAEFGQLNLLFKSLQERFPTPSFARASSAGTQQALASFTQRHIKARNDSITNFIMQVRLREEARLKEEARKRELEILQFMTDTNFTRTIIENYITTTEGKLTLQDIVQFNLREGMIRTGVN